MMTGGTPIGKSRPSQGPPQRGRLLTQDGKGTWAVPTWKPDFWWCWYIQYLTVRQKRRRYNSWNLEIRGERSSITSSIFLGGFTMVKHYNGIINTTNMVIIWYECDWLFISFRKTDGSIPYHQNRYNTWNWDCTYHRKMIDVRYIISNLSLL